MPKGVTAERIGQTLQRLTADLVTARREVIRLRRENRELKAELESLRARQTSSPDQDESPLAPRATPSDRGKGAESASQGATP